MISGKVRWSQCPTCAEQRRVDDEARLKRKERAQQEQRVKESMERSSVPRRFQTRTLDNFRVINGTDSGKVLSTMLTYAADMQQVVSTGRSMIFCGNPGTGKTHLACGIANAAIQAGYTALYSTAYDAILSVKETWRGNGSEREAVNLFTRPDLLVLDEVGVQFGTDAERQIMFRIINRRYEEMRPTIMVSNLMLNDLREMVGDRILDRFKEDGGRVVPFLWASVRR
jgi:DNA replication protein DnaC